MRFIREHIFRENYKTCGGVDIEQFNLLRKLIKGEKVILKFKHRPLEMFDGGIIALWDVWEETFAKVIQRNFILKVIIPIINFVKMS